MLSPASHTGRGDDDGTKEGKNIHHPNQRQLPLTRQAALIQNHTTGMTISFLPSLTLLSSCKEASFQVKAHTYHGHEAGVLLGGKPSISVNCDGKRFNTCLRYLQVTSCAVLSTVLQCPPRIKTGNVYFIINNNNKERKGLSGLVSKQSCYLQLQDSPRS